MHVKHPSFAVIPRFLKWIDALSYLVTARKAVRELQKKHSFSFDLIDVHWTYPDVVAGLYLARRASKKLIVTVRGKEALYLGERTVRGWLIKYCLRRADAVVTLSDELKGLVVRLGVAPQRVRTILNGVDRTLFHPQDQRDCRRRLGLPIDKKIIVSVGALNEGKGHQDLVKAVPRLAHFEDVHLFIVGGPGPGGDVSALLSEQIESQGLSNVHLVGRIAHANLASWYAAADLFCLATRGEGCPNVVLEALSCGTPVVATDVGAIRELIVEGENGFVVPADQTEQLAPTIDKALRRDWDRTAISDRMNEWGWASCAAQVMDTYRSVLGATH